jgi:glycerol-3-phosphate acyltransferase PlsY
MWEWLLIPLAYLMGSLSSAIIVSRVLDLPDPRRSGSRNPGATNVLRLGGKRAAVITLLGDVAKGLLPVLLAKWLSVDPVLLAGVGLSAFIGHLFPVLFGFVGGKGVATALGVLTGFSWSLGLMLLLTWIAVAAVTRLSSFSALVASLLAPILAWWSVKTPEIVAATMIMSLVLIWRHRGNIQRLLKGEESRIGR